MEYPGVAMKDVRTALSGDAVSRPKRRGDLPVTPLCTSTGLPPTLLPGSEAGLWQTACFILLTVYHCLQLYIGIYVNILV
jgi:hypothetical protein